MVVIGLLVIIKGTLASFHRTGDREGKACLEGGVVPRHYFHLQDLSGVPLSLAIIFSHNLDGTSWQY